MVPNKFQPRRGQPGITVDPRGRQVWQMKENGPCSWSIAGTRFRQACGVGAPDMCISQFNFRSSSGTRPTYFRSKLEQARTWICFFPCPRSGLRRCTIRIELLLECSIQVGNPKSLLGSLPNRINLELAVRCIVTTPNCWLQHISLHKS